MDDSIPKQTYHLKDVPTKSLILYPTRAHVTREINNVILEAGQNEIEIYGLGPMVDESSIQIDGTGQATITDITVDLVPNKEDFYDVYPKDDELSEDELEEPDFGESSDPKVKAFAEKISELQKQLEEAQDLFSSAECQLSNLENYFDTMHSKETAVAANTLAETLKVYQEERSRLHRIKSESLKATTEIIKEQQQLNYEKFQAEKAALAEKKKARLEKERIKEKQQRKRDEKRKETERITAERKKFWANKVYRVVVRLEVATATPGSSRRNSLDSVTLSRASPEDLDKITGESKTVASLSLKYICEEAFWTPRYDVNISSLNKTAIISYRAELSNNTSETFKDTKVVLSTSQTSFSGLDDKPPTMEQWNVGLHRTHIQNVDVLSGIAPSKNNTDQSFKLKKRKGNAGLLGFASKEKEERLRQSSAPLMRTAMSSFGGAPPAPASRAPFANAHVAPYQQQMQQQQIWQQDMAAPGANAVLESFEEEESDADEDEARGGLDFKSAEWEDSGLTATYELPGTRTVAPSSTARRHKIATLNATNVILSHISIPKLRAAAFLRAKVKNPSANITLLKGNAGVTLDGSFLGTIALPLVSPYQTFTIPLGVDPAIHINYPKPTVHRSTQGIFSKESAHVFSRSIYITNTKPVPVEITVLDQIPISQDERLKVDVLQPRGLNKENDSVKTGGPAIEGKTGWGKAVATRKKAGEVTWLINVEKSMGCVMKFDYEARMPSTESVMNW
jgi:hypothetical protein